MKRRTAELTGPALDWAVAKCEGITVKYQPGFLTYSEIKFLADWDDALEYSPSTDWSQGGPIIERERIRIVPYPLRRIKEGWWAGFDYADERAIGCAGPTPLIAAMRCFVASRLGDTVEVPDELA